MITDAQKLTIISAFEAARQMRDDLPLTCQDSLDSYERIHQRVSEIRVALGRLDAHIFRLYGELYHMQHPQTVLYHPKPDPQPFTIDDL